MGVIRGGIDESVLKKPARRTVQIPVSFACLEPLDSNPVVLFFL